MKKTILVVDYDPNWPQQFEDLRYIFSNALGDHALAIEHVGSTSVLGLAAKPILDIDIIIRDEVKLNAIIPIMISLGYQFNGEMGIKDRYVFTAVSDFSPNHEANKKWPKHHLYCCIAGTISLNNHLLFRDALRKSPDLLTEYAQLKKNLAAATDDIDIYVESKSAFITDVLKDSGLSYDQVKDVLEQNRKK